VCLQKKFDGWWIEASAVPAASPRNNMACRKWSDIACIVRLLSGDPRTEGGVRRET